MARGLSSALRLALGGVAGGLEGYGAKQERLEKASLLKQQQERQAVLDALNQASTLQNLGFRPTPIRSTMDQAALGATALETPELPTIGAPALQSAFEQARRRDLAPQPTRPGALETPVRLALDTAKTRQFERGAAMQPAQPAMQTAVPGLGRIGWQAPETDEEKAERVLQAYRAQREVDAEIAAKKAQAAQEAADAAYQQMVSRLEQAGYEPQQARRIAALEAKYPDVEQTPGVRATLRGQDISAATARRGQDLTYQAAQDRQQAASAAAKAKQDAAKEQLRAVLPTISETAKTVSGWTPEYIKRLSPTGVNAAMVAAMGATDPAGVLSALALNKVVASPEDRAYAMAARPVADAVARASEVGVLTNQDIARYQSQVSFVAGDDEKTKLKKVRNLQTWAAWLANNQQALAGEGEPTPPPSRGTATTPGGDKQAQRAARWDALKASNPRMSDAQLMAQVMREIP